MYQFEELISNTIEETKDVPEEISETGKVNMSHKGAERWWRREKEGADVAFGLLRDHVQNRRALPAPDEHQFGRLGAGLSCAYLRLYCMWPSI